MGSFRDFEGMVPASAPRETDSQPGSVIMQRSEQHLTSEWRTCIRGERLAAAASGVPSGKVDRSVERIRFVCVLDRFWP